MRWLSLAEVLELQRRLIEESGGLHGVRDLGLLEAALAQPRQTFAGEQLYPTLVDQVAFTQWVAEHMGSSTEC